MKRSERAPLVELVGPAGAGKTSLLRVLTERERTLRGNIVVAPTQYLQDIPPLLPTFVGVHWPYRGLLRKEMKRILYLTTLYRVLEEARRTDETAFVLDEGPVYMLSRMRFFAEGRVESHNLERWWRMALERWAAAIKVIVWLDADNGILAQRIRRRGEPYPSVFMSGREASDRPLFQFLTRYRGIYHRVIGEMLALGTVAVLRFDTGVTESAAVAEAVLQSLYSGGRCAPAQAPPPESGSQTTSSSL